MLLCLFDFLIYRVFNIKALARINVIWIINLIAF